MLNAPTAKQTPSPVQLGWQLCNNINLVHDMLTGIDLYNQILAVIEAGHRLGKVLLLVVLPITDESRRS